MKRLALLRVALEPRFTEGCAAPGLLRRVPAPRDLSRLGTRTRGISNWPWVITHAFLHFGADGRMPFATYFDVHLFFFWDLTRAPHLFCSSFGFQLGMRSVSIWTKAGRGSWR